VLLRLVRQDVALASTGATDEDSKRWTLEGLGWPVRETPDGVRLADAADVLAALRTIGGAA
jgi:hypothetical protein